MLNNIYLPIYLVQIPNAREACVQFKMKREFEVGVVQPVPVKVYDYYEPGKCIGTYERC